MASSQKIEPGYYTPAEVAKILRVHVKTVRHWVVLGELPAIRIRGTIRIPKTVIEMKKSS